MDLASRAALQTVQTFSNLSREMRSNELTPPSHLMADGDEKEPPRFMSGADAKVKEGLAILKKFYGEREQ